MKVSYKNMIHSYRGKKDGLVYYYHPGLDTLIAREYVRPRATVNNSSFGAVAANLKALAPSSGFLQDLATYRSLLARHAATEGYFRGNRWSLYTKIMWAMARKLELDLRSLTREQIYADELPCRTVQAAVEAGLLPPVTGYELLAREF